MAPPKEEKPLEGIELAGKEFGWKEEESEETKDIYVKTDYPEPYKKYRVINESFSLSMEETYFWILGALQYDGLPGSTFPKIDKITDIFSSAESSSIFGQTAQRLGIQQDRITSTLATVGKMIKDLFALVRELRIIDERIAAYDAWYDKEKKVGSKSADATLKQLYIDFVESQGGQTKPSSVYGLAQNLGYTTLPDFYFNTRVYRKEDIDSVVDGLPTNNNLKNVLRRKLLEFIIWKEETEKEIRHRRTFSLHYLRQHWAVIKMYMAWLKPYLRNVKRLSMNEKQILGPEIISAFETAAIEIEILAYNPAKKDGSPCILVNFKYFVKPSLSYQQPESYQRGPIHVGKVDITMRSYGWTAGEVEAYKKYREKQELELLGVIDSSVKAALDALGDDLERYLAQAGEKEFQEKAAEKEAKKEDKRNFLQKFLNARPAAENTSSSAAFGGPLEPFIAVVMGAGEIIGAFIPSAIISPKKGGSVKFEPGNKNAKAANKAMHLVWMNYKKSHQLLTW